MNPSHKPAQHTTLTSWFNSYLESLSLSPSIHLLYSYTPLLPAFAALIPSSHLSLLLSHPSVLHYHPETIIPLHTTRSPDFLGLPPTPSSPAATLDATDVIVAVLDTGVWPESPSFSDTGLPPVPPRWRGRCDAGVDFSPSLCNRKLIGARSFSRGFHAARGGEAAGQDGQREFESVRDRDGHGTHTASTAAGAPVGNASFLGYAKGTARGMATGARVAAYKVCWTTGCFGSDILAGIAAAVEDGVDVISLSLGGGAVPYYRDIIASAAFAATAAGVFVAASAGNSGPQAATLANAAPWLATVGAGTLDREFPATVSLSKSSEVQGVSLYAGPGLGNAVLPLVYGGVGRKRDANSSRLCLAGALDPSQVRGKVVLCDRGVSARVEKGLVVKQAGGAGMVLANTAASGEELVADSHLLPAVAVGRRNGDIIREYVLNAKKPMVSLSFKGTVLGVRPSPVVAAFSSRGPNVVTPEILKPDFIGPGVNILAGWSGSIGPTGLAKDTRRTEFNIMSGTSMSCPHISGLAALLKAAHPSWSPSAIKSALMTTAYTVDNTGSPLRDAAGGSFATPMAYGAGHVDPEKALSPGLIYDMTTEDYIAFLCSLNYSIGHIQAIAKRPNITCSHRLSSPGNLNYPSFSVIFDPKSQIVKYTRELTNVGASGSVYSVNVTGPSSVRVIVKPTKLVFKHVGQKLKYSILFVSKKGGELKKNMEFGWLTWTSRQNSVRSPVAYTWQMLR
ncbi:hypothetical protein J5N97_005854 [Dioscorea zingiberensis]|uniref:Subtilisin-like protease n=1 Tax=Dioscorea zingiberensis TaxID=325984 RepID=A0A9D5HSR3_9LILI|nr:hypothetical protein J5N97_005854 [Dioscorea zingiberensis]